MQVVIVFQPAEGSSTKFNQQPMELDVLSEKCLLFHCQIVGIQALLPLFIKLLGLAEIKIVVSKHTGFFAKRMDYFRFQLPQSAKGLHVVVAKSHYSSVVNVV